MSVLIAGFLYYTTDMHIFFSGIGGVGIGPLAEIALDIGCKVSGSDAAASPMTKQLEDRGVIISLDQSGESMRSINETQPIDWFVYTAALPDMHPELQLAQELDITVSKRDELLSHLINEKNLKLIAVAGTHGKTTTTGMLIWAMKQLSLPVSYSIGTSISFGPSGLYDPSSEYFIYECDEFDRNFLHFQPYLSLITNVDYDHSDTYPTETEYAEAFTQFGQQSQQVVAFSEDSKDSFSTHNDAWLLTETLQLQLAGEHNRRNATLVLKALEKLSLSHEPKSVESFPGTNRRFEKLTDNLYSDYGHHPVEIKATLQMAKEINDQVVLIYQPHQNVRQHEIRQLYTDKVFEDAEEVYWLPTYLSREDPALETLTPQQLTHNLLTTNLHIAEMDDELCSVINKARSGGKLVLCMGAGSIDGWVRTG